jgi:maltose alpha-D-glucosyltransferase / alpha-amylase
MLRAYILDKALYELAYELNNRPSWVYIPLTGVLNSFGSFGPFGRSSSST